MVDYDSLLSFLDSAIGCLDLKEVKANPYIRVVFDTLVSLYDFVNDGLKS